MDTAVMKDVVTAAGFALGTMGVVDAAPPPDALSERQRLSGKAATT